MKTDKKLRIGVVGLGARGYCMLRDVLLKLAPYEIDIIAVCDKYTDRAVNAADMIKSSSACSDPEIYTDYRELCDKSHPDALFVYSAWESHFDIAIYAMKKGIPVGFEVGGAYSIEKLWELCRTYEETGTPCMMLENCCYGERELMALRMVREGIFGDIVHCSGGYHHDLRYEITGGIENRHYRLRNYVGRNCENYPTHELGPIAKILDINNGNRMLTLTSVSSCSKGAAAYATENMPQSPAAKLGFAQGDVITTVIKCATGQTITLTLDTTLPRTYTRAFTVRGTRGGYFGETDSIYIDDGRYRDFEFCGEKLWGNAAGYCDRYTHQIWQNYDPTGGHGGMDYLVTEAFLESVRNGSRPPIDVYDSAAWAAVSVLSEQSISLGGMPVPIPDFTNGAWLCRDDIADAPDLRYGLDNKEIAKKYRKQ